MVSSRLYPGTRLGAVTLAVADLGRAAGVYSRLVGLAEVARDGRRLTLGAGGKAVVQLHEEPGARPAPARASGLYHTAILFPDRAALARVVRHIAASGYAFTGASDHLVSEAFYLDDPDGNGVELYRDRPRAEWRWDGDRVEMASLPLDIEGLLAEADGPFDGAPDETRIGHVHLKVSDIADAEAFYTGEVGFAVMARFGSGATFLAADGYHHHLGANVWQSRGAAPAPAGSAGLREFTIEVPGGDDRMLTDPWGHRVAIRRV